MQLVTASALLTVGLIGVGGAILYKTTEDASRERSAFEPAAAEENAAAVQDLRQELSHLRVAIAELRDDLAQLASREIAASGSSASGAASAAAAAELDPRKAETTIAALLEGAPGEQKALRQFVFSAIEQERTERREAERRRAEERARERRELSQGPYGKFNLKINSLGEKLGLDDRQKQVFHDSLLWYEEQKAELKKTVDRTTPTGRKRYEEGKQSLREQYQVSVAGTLSPAQTETWEQASSWEKAPDTSGAFAYSTVWNVDAADAVLGEVQTALETVHLSVGGESADAHVEFSSEGPSLPEPAQPATNVAK